MPLENNKYWSKPIPTGCETEYECYEDILEHLLLYRLFYAKNYQIYVYYLKTALIKTENYSTTWTFLNTS